MRRVLSISLILLLWLPALVALIPGTEDARLPFCCRRQGMHHCAMDDGAAVIHAGPSGPAFKASSRCPQFPAALPATLSSIFAVAATLVDWPSLTSATYTQVARREAARAGRMRAQLDRGPPSSNLA